MSHWRRTRMISFRVSENEFELLKAKSEAEGARNVSEFARLTLCAQTDRASAHNGHSNSDAARFNQLRDELEELGRYVRRIAELIEPSRTPARAGSPMLAMGVAQAQSSGRQNGGV